MSGVDDGGWESVIGEIFISFIVVNKNVVYLAADVAVQMSHSVEANRRVKLYQYEVIIFCHRIFCKIASNDFDFFRL